MTDMAGLWDMHEVLARMESGDLAHPEIMQVRASLMSCRLLPEYRRSVPPLSAGPAAARNVAEGTAREGSLRPPSFTLASLLSGVLFFCLLTCSGAAAAQEVASSPMLIDAVQALLSNSAAYASLAEHPEMAPFIRSLRRLVGARPWLRDCFSYILSSLSSFQMHSATCIAPDTSHRLVGAA